MFIGRVQIFRLSDDRERRLLFRGWSRLCLHAASVTAAEGASAGVAATASGLPAEATEDKSIIAAEKPEERESRDRQDRRAKSLVSA